MKQSKPNDNLSENNDYISRDAAIRQLHETAKHRYPTSYTMGMYAAMNELAHLSAAEVRHMEWISVEEQMPKAGMRVLAYNQTGDMMLGTYSEWGWFFPCYFSPPTHWMLLPAPPKDVRGGQDNA